MKVTDIVVDAIATLGKRLLVVDVVPSFEYRDGVRTDNIIGYRYITVLPERKMDKLAVKIDGPAQIDAPSGCVEVSYEGLELSVYWARGEYGIAAKATKVKVLKEIA